MKKILLSLLFLSFLLTGCSEKEVFQPVRILSGDADFRKEALEMLSDYIERYGKEGAWNKKEDIEREIRYLYPSASVRESYEYIDTAKENFSAGVYRTWIIEADGGKECVYLLPIEEEHGQFQSLFYEFYQELEKENEKKEGAENH